jgi:ATP-dependent DNA helicase RecQ
LFLNDYEDADGKQRFEKALNNIKDVFNENDQEYILNEIIKIAKHLDDHNREELCISLTIFYPDKIEYLAEHLKLEQLLYKVYQEKVEQLSKLNKQLYEQFTKIQ